MARFLGTAAGRTAGAEQGSAAFTKAKVFSTPGTTSFTLPGDVKKAKVFVLGAGSCYRTGSYCFASSACCSGVTFPRSCYCAAFTGHLTGAGGGYAEKTYGQSIAGQTLTINVGSIGGLSASSVAVSGETTVTATNATESLYCWNCTSNSTARDNTNDNPISTGFQLPTCGYYNCFTGYYNLGGTASGGDINRSGGRGVLIPEFETDSYFDAINSCTSSAGGGSIQYFSSCWTNPSFYCSCMCGYHYTFGSTCYFSAVGCHCYRLCSCIFNLCQVPGGSSVSIQQSRFTFTGKSGKCSSDSSCMYFGSECCLASVDNASKNTFIKETPIGIGAESGTSYGSGKIGGSELSMVDMRCYQNCCCTAAGGGAGDICVYCTYYNAGYDYSFGGTGFINFCQAFWPGCFSGYSCRGTGCCWTACYSCLGYAFTFVFGSCQSHSPACMILPYGAGRVGGGTPDCCCCTNRVYNMGFINDATSCTRPSSVIPLSTLVSDTNTNINDIAYGSGATVGVAATYGGGGNRLNPAGGSGLVVVVY